MRGQMRKSDYMQLTGWWVLIVIMQVVEMREGPSAHRDA